MSESGLSELSIAIQRTAEWEGMAEHQKRAAYNEVFIQQVRSRLLVEIQNQAARWLNEAGNIEKEAREASSRWGIQRVREDLGK